MKESDIQNKAMLTLSRGVTRLFRNVTAMGWGGKVTIRKGNIVTIHNARPIHAGLCKGLIRYYRVDSIEITPEMVGKKVAVFTAIEFKAPGKKPTTEQAHFGEQVVAAGGLFGVAWTVGEAAEIIEKYDKSLISKG